MRLSEAGKCGVSVNGGTVVYAPRHPEVLRELVD